MTTDKTVEQPAPGTTETEPPAPAGGGQQGGNSGGGEPARLPDDHPLVKAYQATKNELSTTRGKVKEFEDRDKSETEKLQDDLAAAQADATTSKSEVARLKAAIKHGLSEDDLELLGTGTPEEIEARAERLAKRLGTAGSADGKKPITSLGKPKEPQVDPDTWLRDLAKRS